METISSVTRKLFAVLIGSSVRRCLISGVLCRLTISLKFFQDSDPPSVRISISDTGIGSTLMEFQELNDAVVACSNKWDGVLTITTTGVSDKEICHYCLNFRESIASKTRLKRLPPTQKNVGIFSGTEVCLTTEERFDELMIWIVDFVQKMLVLKNQNVAIELVVDHIDYQETKCNHLLQGTDNASLPLSMSCIEFLVSGLEDYVLKHEKLVEEKYRTCSVRREDLKVGIGQVSSIENSRGTGQIVEVVIVIANMASEPCCWRANSSTTQDFSPSLISQSSFNAVANVDWQRYGLGLIGNFVDGDGHAVLKWENIQSFSHIDIAIHSYNRIMIPQARQETAGTKNLIKKAVKGALDDLKAKYTGLFLSSHAIKIQAFVPDLSKSIAGLILSSNDLEFQGECAALLGVEAVDSGAEERIESCIKEKIIGIVEMNDRRPKGERDNGQPLFECESLGREDCLDDEDELAQEDLSTLDF